VATNSNFKLKALSAINNKLAFISGQGSRNLAQNLAAALVLGNEHDRLRGLNQYGQPQTPVKPRRGRYKGASGPPLAPFGAASRVVTQFRARVKGSRPPYTIAAGWEAVVSASGFPFLVALSEGVRGKPRGKTKLAGGYHRIRAKLAGGWRIPPRPIFGISPNTWQLVREQIAEFKAAYRKVR
jgi:hypothetical protein